MMKLVLALFLSFNVMANVAQYGTVCVIIDANDTHNEYPHHARLASNPSSYKPIYHRRQACFDLNETYYMQSFVREEHGTITYSIRCSYEPNAKDEGKILYLTPEGQSSRCLIEDPFTIDESQSG